jgi:hypothetical protein
MKELDLTFPVFWEDMPGIPINNHPGAYGHVRKHNRHEGVDLYVDPGTLVTSMALGTVVAIEKFTGDSTGTSWWLETSAITVKDDLGYFVYGEIIPGKDMEVGKVVAGNIILGKVTPVLPPDKQRPDIPGHKVSMLHLERYSLDYDPSMGWASWGLDSEKPKYLLDPTPFLIDALYNDLQNEWQRIPTFLTM